MTYDQAVLVFLGMVGIMTLYVGAQAIVLRERTYGTYALYAACWFGYVFFKNAYTFADPAVERVVAPFNRIGFPMLAYVLYYQFAFSFLDMRHTLPRVYRVFRWMQGAILTYVLAELIICVFFTDWTARPAHEVVHTVVRTTIALVSVWGISRAFRIRSNVFYYFVTGSALLVVFSLTSMILSIRLSDDSLDTSLWSDPMIFMQTGIVLELLCFSLGLSFKNKQTEIDKIRAEQTLEIEREQRTIEQLKTHFFTNISHEFRTPLTLLLGPLAELRRQEPSNDLFSLMHRNATRLLTLVNQLLDLTKLDAGQLDPVIASGNLTEWLRLLVGSFSSLADSHDIRLTFVGPDLAEPVFFDRDKLEKIVSNLLTNALKFTPDGGSVLVSLTYESGNHTATIRVEDSGVGIPIDQQALIFNRFYQVVDTLSVGGTGIGLALVRELVNVLKGQVSVMSAVGQGTTFTIQLPVDADTWTGKISPAASRAEAVSPGVYEDERRQDVDKRVHNPAETDAEKPLLLIVDDNADVRQYLRQLLTDQYRLAEATDGRAGLAEAGQLIPDLVICDLMMPQLDGFAFCQALKTQPTTDHIPIIMLTAKAGLDSRVAGFERGADDYLTKPFHPVELRARVQNLLLQRRKLRDLFSRELRLKPTDVVVTSVEEQFLQQAIALVEREMGNSAFTVEALAAELNLSRMQLHRKLKALSGQSATEFVRHLRLQRAADLLAGRSASVSEVAYRVGFESLSYFTKAFKEQFGTVPSEYERVSHPTPG